MDLKEIDMWVDGSAIKGEVEGSFHGGAGVCLIYKGKERHLSIPIEDGTNNIAELSAPLFGLRSLKERCRVTIYSDSMYTINCLTKWLEGWKRRGWKTTNGEDVKNKDLIIALSVECDKHIVDWVKVKAHSGNYYNELVDGLAVKASSSLRRSI